MKKLLIALVLCLAIPAFAFEPPEDNLPKPFYLAKMGLLTLAGSGADTTPPEVTEGAGTNIDAAGTTLTIAFSEAVSEGTGYDDADWTLSCSTTGPLTVAHSTGDGTASWGMAITGGPVQSEATDTCTLDWAGTEDGVQDGATPPNDLAAIDPVKSIVNNSTQGAASNNIEFVSFIMGETGSATSIATGAQSRTAGNTIVVFTGCSDNQAVVSVSNGTDSFSKLDGFNNASDGDLEVWVAYNIAGGSTNITTSWAPASVNYPWVAAIEYSGIASASQLDDTGTTNVTASTTQSVQVTATNAYDVVVSVFNEFDVHTYTTTGLNERGRCTDGVDYACFVDQLTESTGTKTNTITVNSNGSNNYNSIAAALKSN